MGLILTRTRVNLQNVPFAPCPQTGGLSLSSEDTEGNSFLYPIVTVMPYVFCVSTYGIAATATELRP